MSIITVGLVLLVGVLILWGIASLLRSGKAPVRFVEIACVVTILAAAVSGVVGLISSLVADVTTVEVPLAVHAPDIRIPGLTVYKPTAVILSGGADRATITVKGLTWVSRLLLSAENVVQVSVTIVIALLVLRFARNLRAGTPFDGLHRSVTMAAVVLFLGTVTWTVVGGIGSYIAGREALQIHGMGADDGTIAGQLFEQVSLNPSYYGWPEPTLYITLPFWPLGVAGALALLAAAFRAGERMQADTKGLI